MLNAIAKVSDIPRTSKKWGVWGGEHPSRGVWWDGSPKFHITVDGQPRQSKAHVLHPMCDFTLSHHQAYTGSPDIPSGRCPDQIKREAPSC